MTNKPFKGAFVAVAILLSLCACGCPKPPQAEGEPPQIEIHFSIANEDRRAPLALMEIAIDDNSIYRGGMIASPGGGQYTYIKTTLPQETGAILTIKSETDTGTITEKKSVWLKDRLWVVITRVRDENDTPSIQISVSYEAPM